MSCDIQGISPLRSSGFNGVSRDTVTSGYSDTETAVAVAAAVTTAYCAISYLRIHDYVACFFS